MSLRRPMIGLLVLWATWLPCISRQTARHTCEILSVSVGNRTRTYTNLHIYNATPAKDSQIQHDVYSLRYYKVVQNRTEVYDIVTRVFHRKEGWEELPHGPGLSNAWNLCWTWSKPKLDYSRLCVAGNWRSC